MRDARSTILQGLRSAREPRRLGIRLRRPSFAAQAVLGRCAVEQVGLDRPVDARVALVVPGVAFADPATPYEWSVSLADQLSSGVLVTRVGEGHTGYNKGNPCVDRAVETYLLDGTPPEDGLRCE